jgi:acyl-CoA thioester hydrolase
MSGDLDTPYQGGFVGKTHRFALRVYFEDTDVAGIVYYANYLRFMERARSDMLRAVGIDQRAVMEQGEGVYAVAEVAIKYRGSAKLDDALVVVSEVVQVRAAACVIHQRVMRGDELLADAMVTAAFITADGRPKRQPREWTGIFERLRVEGKE